MLVNNVIADNHGVAGGGISFQYTSNAVIQNSVFYGNSARLYGTGIYLSAQSSLSLINTILWGNVPDSLSQLMVSETSSTIIVYSDIGDTLWPGLGNMSVDPLFRDPENGDFHLMSTACGDPYDSPCIDAGDPNIIDSLLDCSWGLGGLRSDMGAYGGGDSVTVRIDHDDIPIPRTFSLSQNYPNPFNATTIIRYALPERADVRIEIYDILGRRVETLLDEKQRAGYHQIIWYAAEHSSGMYFYRIQAGGYAETRKMVLLK